MSDLEEAKVWLNRSGHNGDVIEAEIERLHSTEARLLARVEELEKKRFHTGAQVMKHFKATGGEDG